MIDLHCHLLFGVDDGPQRLEDSLALAEALVADGVTQVVATPHILEPLFAASALRDRVEDLAREFTARDIPLQLLSGGENHYSLSLDELRTHTINAGRYLLLEFPHDRLPASAAELIFALRRLGLIPIIAHPERNASLLRNPELLQPLLDQGALAQLTAASLVGDFGSPVRQCARYLLKKRMVHFIASDAHAADWRRPRMQAGFEQACKLIGTGPARKLVTDNPALVIADREWDHG